MDSSLTEHPSAEVVRRFWGDAARGRRAARYPVHWLGSSLVLRHIVNPRISGDPGIDWLEWVRRRFVPGTMRSAFVLGSGGGTLERRAAAMGICESFHCIDLSPEAVAVAQALAAREGRQQFRYETGDANRLCLPGRSFDLVLADMSLHHITRLEHVLDTFRAALRPGGLLVVNEFTGPDRFQWTDLQLELATRAIRALPLRLRRNRDPVTWKRWLKPWVGRAKRWSPERIAAVDPSESVRSSEIPGLLEARFRILARKDYGGALLALVLNNIVGNFTNSQGDVARLRRLANEEEAWMESGRLGSDYTLVVASPS